MVSSMITLETSFSETAKVTPVVASNFCSLFGCQPSVGVDAETAMCSEICEAFIANLDRKKLISLFPNVLKNLISKDASFEMVSSQTLQTLQLNFDANTIKKHRVTIFVTTELQGKDGSPSLTYDNALEKGKKLEELFTNPELLPADKTELCVNFSRDQVIAKFNELNKEAEEHEPVQRSVFALTVAFIGHKIDELYPASRKILKSFGLLEHVYLLEEKCLIL